MTKSSPPAPPPPERDTFLLAIGGTLAVHVLVIVALDVRSHYAWKPPKKPAPRIELVEVQVDPPKPPPPPPPVARELPPPPKAPNVVPKVRSRQPPPQEEAPPPVAKPPDPSPPDPGGAQVVTMKDVAPAAVGVAVAKGTRTSDRVGQGGKGTGTGAGDGAGSGSAAPPVSVATIKTRAMPKGDYGYFDARKDYPPEARQLGVEGTIRVRLVVNAQGKVTEKRLLNKLGHGLDELALSRAEKFEFEPAKDTNDKPVASVVVWTFTFTLPE